MEEGGLDEEAPQAIPFHIAFQSQNLLQISSVQKIFLKVALMEIYHRSLAYELNMLYWDGEVQIHLEALRQFPQNMQGEF